MINVVTEPNSPKILFKINVNLIYNSDFPKTILSAQVKEHKHAVVCRRARTDYCAFSAVSVTISCEAE